MKIYAELRFKHGKIIKFLEDNNMNIKELSALADISQALLGNFIRFQGCLGKPRQEKLVKAMSEIDPSITMDDIFPHDIKKAISLFKEKRVIAKDIDLSKAIPVREVAGLLTSPEHSAADYNDDKKDSEKILDKIIGAISGRDKEVIEAYYGLNGKDELTYEEIGKKYGLVRERVRQILCSAKGRLKKRAVVMGVETEFVEGYMVEKNRRLTLKNIENQINKNMKANPGLFKRWLHNTIKDKFIANNLKHLPRYIVLNDINVKLFFDKFYEFEKKEEEYKKEAKEADRKTTERYLKSMDKTFNQSEAQG